MQEVGYDLFNSTVILVIGKHDKSAAKTIYYNQTWAQSNCTAWLNINSQDLTSRICNSNILTAPKGVGFSAKVQGLYGRFMRQVHFQNLSKEVETSKEC